MIWAWAVAGVALPARGAEPPSVALLNLTARHVDAEQVAAFSRNLREAFLLEPRVRMLEERAMYDALSGPDAAGRLKQARTLLAEAKKDFRADKHTLAKQKLEAARALHRTLHSEISRPAELADLLLFQGLVLERLREKDLAQVTFLQMFLLDPSIDVTRLPGIPASAMAVIEAARVQEQSAPLKGVNARFAGEIAGKLEVSHLLTGVVEADEGGGEGHAVLKLHVLVPGGREPVATLVFDVGDASAGLPQPGASIFQRIIGISLRTLQPAP